MEQRPLRLGDLVDDYCPRERRVTNHAIVAIVGEAIRQTRCTTCETEHVFKAGRPPRRRAKEGEADAPVDNTGGQLVQPQDPEPITASVEPEAVVEMSAEPASEPAAEAEERSDEIWPANRTLIRATLPRTENDVPPPRPIPEFTIYQRHNSRGANPFRRSWSDRSGQPPGNGARGDRRSGMNQGGPGAGGGRRRHGKKRPR